MFYMVFLFFVFKSGVYSFIPFFFSYPKGGGYISLSWRIGWLVEEVFCGTCVLGTNYLRAISKWTMINTPVFFCNFIPVSKICWSRQTENATHDVWVATFWKNSDIFFLLAHFEFQRTPTWRVVQGNFSLRVFHVILSDSFLRQTPHDAVPTCFRHRKIPIVQSRKGFRISEPSMQCGDRRWQAAEDEYILVEDAIEVLGHI